MMLISEQVKILLERMDLHPEEFVRPYEARRLNSKWAEVLNEGCFNLVERLLLRRKYDALRRKATQEMIMQTIVSEPSPEENQYSFDTVTRMMMPSKSVTEALLKNPRIRLKQTKV